MKALEVGGECHGKTSMVGKPVRMDRNVAAAPASSYCTHFPEPSGLWREDVGTEGKGPCG